MTSGPKLASKPHPQIGKASNRDTTNNRDRVSHHKGSPLKDSPLKASPKVLNHKAKNHKAKPHPNKDKNSTHHHHHMARHSMLELEPSIKVLTQKTSKAKSPGSLTPHLELDSQVTPHSFDQAHPSVLPIWEAPSVPASHHKVSPHTHCRHPDAVLPHTDTQDLPVVSQEVTEDSVQLADSVHHLVRHSVPSHQALMAHMELPTVASTAGMVAPMVLSAVIHATPQQDMVNSKVTHKAHLNNSKAPHPKSADPNTKPPHNSQRIKK